MTSLRGITTTLTSALLPSVLTLTTGIHSDTALAMTMGLASPALANRTRGGIRL